MRRWLAAAWLLTTLCVSALAQLPGLQNPMLVGASGADIVTTFQSTTNTGGADINLATITFTTQAIGTADANRTVCGGFGGRTQGSVATTFTSGTIGGIAATTIVAPGSQSDQAVIICALVPTGTTATFAYTFANAMSRAGHAAWSLTNVQTLTPTATATSTASPFTSGAISNSAGGTALVSAWCGDARTFTATNYGEDVDAQVQSANSYEMGHQDQAAAGSVTYTTTQSSACTVGSRVGVYGTLR